MHKYLLKKYERKLDQKIPLLFETPRCSDDEFREFRNFTRCPKKIELKIEEDTLKFQSDEVGSASIPGNFDFNHRRIVDIGRVIDLDGFY